MRRKRNGKEINYPPEGIQVLEFEPGEFQPLIVAGKDIERVVIGYSAKAAANDRSRKVGCRYFVRNGRPYYLVADLVEHFTQNMVETTND